MWINRNGRGEATLQAISRGVFASIYRRTPIPSRAFPVSGRWLPRLIWIVLGIALALAFVEYFRAHFH